MRSWRIALLALSLPAALTCLLAPTAAWWLPGELAVHWSRHAALALIPALAAWRYHDRCTGLLLGCFLLGLWPWLTAPRMATSPAIPAGSTELRVVSANLLAFTNDQSPGLAAVMARGADVVVLVEFRPRRADAAIITDGRYPFRTIGPLRLGDPEDGIAVLSRYPLDQVKIDPSGLGLSVRIATPAGGVQLIALHLTTPMGFEKRERRNRYLNHVAALVPGMAGPVILAGDWNCTEGSPAWRPIAASGLIGPEDIQSGSWPSPFGVFGIRIDHILVKHCGLQSTESFVIPKSDHRGLDAVIRLAPSAPGRSP